MRALGVVLAALAWFSPVTIADEAGHRERLLEQAVQTYRSAQSLSERDERLAGFDRARRLFAAAAKTYPDPDFPNPDLLANLGTSALQAEQIGPAVLAFRRALARAPGHARSARNLAQARALLPAWVPRPETQVGFSALGSVDRIIAPGLRPGVAAIAFLVGALAMSAGIFWRQRAARNVGWLAWLITAGLLLTALSRATDAAGAVVIVPEAIARASDSSNAPPRFPGPLPGGTELTLLETRANWARVALADGRDAWVLRSSVAAVEPVPAD